MKNTIQKKTNQYNTYQFSFNEDSSFSYLEIWQQNNAEGIVIIDTTTMLNGKFKTSKDPGLPWYILELDADYIYEKEIKDSLDGILLFTDFNENEFGGFEDKYFTNTNSSGHKTRRDGFDGTNGCFTMHTKQEYRDPSGCNDYKQEGVYWYLKNSKTFCLRDKPNLMENNL